MATLKYLFEHIFGLRCRRHIGWALVFLGVYYFLFKIMAEYIGLLLDPHLVRFEPDENIRINMRIGIVSVVIYAVFGISLIYARRVHHRFSAWVLYLIALVFALIGWTSLISMILMAIISMYKGRHPFDPEIRKRARHGESVVTRAGHVARTIGQSSTARTKPRMMAGGGRDHPPYRRNE